MLDRFAGSAIGNATYEQPFPKRCIQASKAPKGGQDRDKKIAPYRDQVAQRAVLPGGRHCGRSWRISESSLSRRAPWDQNIPGLARFL